MFPKDWKLRWQLLAGMYNRRVTDVHDVIDRLIFTTAAEESHINIILFDIFQLQVKRYLAGISHPLLLKGIAISEETFADDIDDCLLRCCLFLLAITDSDLLPQDNTTLEVSPVISRY